MVQEMECITFTEEYGIATKLYQKRERTQRA